MSENQNTQKTSDNEATPRRSCRTLQYGQKHPGFELMGLTVYAEAERRDDAASKNQDRRLSQQPTRRWDAAILSHRPEGQRRRTHQR